MPEDRQNTRTPITLRDRSLCLFGVLIRSIFDMYVIDADGSNLVTPADRPAFDGGPAWSPDSQKIAFSSGVEWDKVEVFLTAAVESGGSA